MIVKTHTSPKGHLALRKLESEWGESGDQGAPKMGVTWELGWFCRTRGQGAEQPQKVRSGECWEEAWGLAVWERLALRR